MAQTATKRAAEMSSPVFLTVHDGQVLFPTPAAQQDYLRGLDPARCAPSQVGRKLRESPTPFLPMVEVMRERSPG